MMAATPARALTPLLHDLQAAGAHKGKRLDSWSLKERDAEEKKNGGRQGIPQRQR